MEAKFHKKATGTTFFTCNDGEQIAARISETIRSKISKEVKAHSVGKNAAGDVVAEFWFTWSFKGR
jgi:hypothetical protein